MAANMRSVDLSAYPDLIVVYLGFRLGTWRDLPRLLGIGRGLNHTARHKPDGLLAHENLLWGWMHVGMRQYWRDLDAMLAYTRAPQHAAWWRDFGQNPGRNGFWHETYSRRGGMEAIYLNMPPIGLSGFAACDPSPPSARARLEQDRAAG